MIFILVILLIVVFVIAISRFVFREWIRPNFIMKWYKSTLESLGYSVVYIPYQPFKIPLANIHQYN